MSKEIVDKPFWLKSPWMILFDLIKLHRIRPWNVNISYLLVTFIREMSEKGFIDFTASGVALLSSATIYRMKSEIVLALQKPPQPLPERHFEAIPPPIQLPYRHEYSAVNVDDLIQAFEEVLKKELLEIKPPLGRFTSDPPLVQKLDHFMINIEDHIRQLHQFILKLIDGGKIVAFSKITSGQNKIEVIRSLILILFIASRGEISLWQDEEFGEIYVSSSEKRI